MSDLSERRVAIGIFFLVLALYIVTYNGAFKSNDERALFSGIDSFVKRGAFTTDQIYWDYTHVGVFTTAGDMVPNYEPAQMVAAIPLYLWGRALGAAVQGVMFFGAGIMAASASLIYLCLLELGCRRRSSLLGAFVFAFATAAWPYSRSFFREPLTILAYLLAFYGLFRYRDRPSPIAHRTSYIVHRTSSIVHRPSPIAHLAWLALSGFALGLALTTKQIGVAVVPSLLLLLIVYPGGPAVLARLTGRRSVGRTFMSGRPGPTTTTRPDAAPPGDQSPGSKAAPAEAGWRPRVVAMLAFFLPLAFMLLLNWWYTTTTLGGVETFARDVVDYTTNPQLSSSAPARMLRAAVGLTISPYKGLFWFSPALLLGLIGAVPFIRRRPWEGLALLTAAAIHLLGYSRYNYWSGGVTWGSRYMLQAVPFLVLLTAPVWRWLAADDGRRTTNDRRRTTEDERRTTNNRRRTTEDDRRTTNDGRPIGDDSGQVATDKSANRQIAFHVSRLTFHASRFAHHALHILIWLLIALSVLIQLLGMAVDYRAFEVKWLLDNAEVWGGIGQAIEGLFMRPAESPVVGHVRLLLSGTQPLDFAWVQLRPEGKWAFVPRGLLLSLFLAGLAAAAFAAIWRRSAQAGRIAGLMAAATALVCSALLLVYRQGDARFDPYNVDRFLKPMLAALEKTATYNDVLLVPDPTLTDYFLNYLAAPLVWYSVEPRPVDERLMAQLLARYGRVWLARDRNAAADDAEDRRGWERYLTDHAYKLDEQRFDDWGRLLRFSAAGRPAEVVAPQIALGDMVLLEAHLSLEQPSAAPVGEEPLADGKVQAHVGDTLQVGLRWRTTAPPVGNYTVFLQLLDANSQVKVQADRWPGDGLYPTVGLSAGRIITDNVALPLAVAPGNYRLIAGLYRGDLPGYPRLAGPAGDHVLLAGVEVR